MFQTDLDSVFPLMLLVNFSHDVFFLVFIRYLDLAFNCFSCMKSSCLLIFLNFLIASFLSLIDFLMSFFHQGSLGLGFFSLVFL